VIPTGQQVITQLHVLIGDGLGDGHNGGRGGGQDQLKALW